MKKLWIEDIYVYLTPNLRVLYLRDWGFDWKIFIETKDRSFWIREFYIDTSC